MAAPDPDSLVLWRRRADVLARPQGSGWVLKDPLTLRYFQLQDEEYFVWSLLTGRITLVELCREFAARFAPRQLTPDEAQRFVGQLAQQALVVADVTGTAAATARRREAQQRRKWSAWTNVLAIRFRGFDPDRWLSRLLPWCSWIFSPGAALLGGLIIASALLLWLTHYREFAGRWPQEVAQWTVTDLWSLAAVLAGVKVLHELGHGLACKRFGGEVHELGVMLLVFTPCLYCNVSDAWLLPSRWQRIVISAAGMWVEAVLASLAAWLWFASEPGWFHGLCLQVVFICGLSTLVFNLNPLLRYDGYFILSDLWDIPNLSQQAGQELRRTLWTGLTGEPLPSPAMTSRRRSGLLIYAIASLAYRLLVLAVILWAVYHWLEPQGLGVLGQMIAACTLLTLGLGPLMHVWQTSRDPERRREWRPLLSPRPLVLLTFVVALVFVPLPRRLPAPVLIEPADSVGLFVTMEGRLESLVAPGTAVEAGEDIARLSNSDLQRRLEKIDGELAAAQHHVEGLQRRQIIDSKAGLMLPAARQTCQDLEQQRKQLQADVDRLIIRAPRAGIVWPMPERPATSLTEQLPTWSGSPFQSRNRQAWLSAGTQLGWIGPPDQFEATAYVSQQQIGRVSIGGRARVLSDALPETPLQGTIREVAAAQSAGLSASLAQRLQLPQVTDAAGGHLVGRWYQVQIALEAAELPAVTGVAGQAYLEAPSESIWSRLVGWLYETFPGLGR